MLKSYENIPLKLTLNFQLPQRSLLGQELCKPVGTKYSHKREGRLQSTVYTLFLLIGMCAKVSVLQNASNLFPSQVGLTTDVGGG